MMQSLTRRASGSPRARVAGVALALALLAGRGAHAAPEDATAASPPLRLEGVTFVGSRGSDREMLVVAERATFRPGERVARLEQVRTQMRGTDGAAGFEMTCDEGELHTDTSDFIASGNVKGSTGDGRRFSTTWVRYEHRQGLAFTDAPVLVEEAAGTYRGGGFRYQVREQRFRFIGGASLVRQ